MGKIEEIYETYKAQIEDIVRVCRGNLTKAGEIITWAYGVGTSESWRKFLRKKPIRAPKSKVVEEFLASLAQKKRTK
jgi:hypothetical protein